MSTVLKLTYVLVPEVYFHFEHHLLSHSACAKTVFELVKYYQHLQVHLAFQKRISL